MSERTWKDWTRTDWYNAAYCDHCGLPLLEIADDEAGTRGHYECIYCTWMDDHDVETNSLRAQVAALQTALEEEGHRNAVFTACLHKAQNLYLEAHPDYPGWPDGAVNITWVLEAFDKERAEVKRLQAALAAANEDAERLADKLSEVVAYGGYYADIENRMPPDGQTFKVIAVSPSGVDDFTVLRMDGKLYFASDPPREVPNGFEIIRIKPWDVKTFGKTEEEDF